SGRGQRRVACGKRSGADGFCAGRPARSMAAASDRGGCGETRGQAVTARLAPRAVVGILGGGQLRRMLAMAAAPPGPRAHIYTPDPQSCAFDVVRRSTLADYGDEAALDGFAREVDVVTYEFENVPADAAMFLASRRPVLPDPTVLATTQDRLVEKDSIAELGIATAPYLRVGSPAELARAPQKPGLPARLKTRRLRPYRKGQNTIHA